MNLIIYTQKINFLRWENINPSQPEAINHSFANVFVSIEFYRRHSIFYLSLEGISFFSFCTKTSSSFIEASISPL